MGRSKHITRQDVLNVVAKFEEYPELKRKDLAKLCGISDASVSRILNGDYDHLLDDTTDNSTLCDGKYFEDILDSIKNVDLHHKNLEELGDAYGDSIVTALSDIADRVVAELRALRKLQVFAIECKLYEMDPRTNYSPDDMNLMKEKLEELK